MRRSRRKTNTRRRINTKRILRKKNSLRRSKRYSKKNTKKRNTKKINTKSRIRSRNRVNKRNTKRIRRKRRVMKGGAPAPALPPPIEEQSIREDPSFVFDEPTDPDSSLESQDDSLHVADESFEPEPQAEQLNRVSVSRTFNTDIVMRYLKGLLNGAEDYSHTSYPNCHLNIAEMFEVQGETCNKLDIHRIDDDTIQVYVSEIHIVKDQIDTNFEYMIESANRAFPELLRSRGGGLNSTNTTVAVPQGDEGIDEVLAYWVATLGIEVFFVIILAWMVEQTLEWLRWQIPRVIRMLAHPVNLILIKIKNDNTITVEVKIPRELMMQLEQAQSPKEEQKLAAQVMMRLSEYLNSVEISDELQNTEEKCMELIRLFRVTEHNNRESRERLEGIPRTESDPESPPLDPSQYENPLYHVVVEDVEEGED